MTLFIKTFDRAQVPDIYQKISKDICEADANAVNMGRMNKNFYEFGKYVSKFDRVGYIGPMLVDVNNFDHVKETHTIYKPF